MVGYLNSLFDLKILNPTGLRDHEKVGTVGRSMQKPSNGELRSELYSMHLVRPVPSP